MRAAPAPAAYAGNLFFASAGTPICGREAPTGMRIGTAPAWLRGSSGTLRAVRQSCCGECKAGAARRPAKGFGKTPRSIIASRCSGSGANFAMRRGRLFWRTGDCRTFRSSIAKATRQNARQRRGTDRRRVLPRPNSPDRGRVVETKTRAAQGGRGLGRDRRGWIENRQLADQ